MANTSNIKTIKKRVEAIHPTIDSSLETIKNSLIPYNFLEVNENGFNKSNVLKDLANNFNKVPKSAPIGKIGNDVMGNEVQNAYPATPDMLKPGVSIVDVENPTQLITSNNNSNTIATDRADGNKDIKRWITRSIFKFREEDYGFDRQVYEIPVKLLMEGIVGVDDRHSTTLQEYPYPEEIVMISQKTDKNFIHFLNVQYSDSHYNYYRGKPYNLMIVKDRIDYGSVNTNGDGFNYYTSVYANNVEESLAFYKDGYLYLSMPDKSFGEELLNTLWDCKIIWRKDAPNREFTIQYDAESFEKNIEISQDNLSWTQCSIPNSNTCEIIGNDDLGIFVAMNNMGSKCTYSKDGINWNLCIGLESVSNWQSIVYGKNKFVAVAPTTTPYSAYSTDGINWTLQQFNGYTGGNHRPTNIFYGNNMFICSCYAIYYGSETGTQASQTFYTSTDGFTWKPSSSGIVQSYWPNLAYIKNKWIGVSMVDGGRNAFMYSTDGINWTVGSVNGESFSGSWAALATNGDLLIVASQNGGIIATSTDGIQWTVSTKKINRECVNKIIYTNDDKFIAISGTEYDYFGGFSDKIDISTDGLNWREVTIGHLGAWNDIAYANFKYVMISGFTNAKFIVSEKTVKNPIFSNLSELSGKSYLFGETSYLSPNINSISQLDEFTNPLVTNNSISMGLSNNKGSLYRIPNYTTPYDLTFIDELSWSLTNFPNMLIPITNKYQLGLNYITGVYSESSVMKNTLYCSLFDNIIHKADPKIKTTGDSNYPCDKLVTNFDSDSHIIKVIPIYSSNMRTNDNNGSIEVMVYTTKKKYKVVFTVTDSVLSFITTTISTFNGFEIADVKQISSTKAILITSTYNVYLDVIKEDSQTANPFGLSGVITPYLLSKYNIVGINASKVVSSLADCSNTSKFASGINNGAIDVVINNSKLSGDGKYFINSGRYSIMKDNADTNYLVHLKEKYTFSSELDAPYSKNFDWGETSGGLSRNRYWSAICYGNDKFVAVADQSNTFAYSTDGIVWTETSNGLGSITEDERWMVICYGRDKFVAFTYSNTFAYSTNGIIWTKTSQYGINTDWHGMCYARDKFVAIGNSLAAYSTDGINWTPTTNGLNSIVWNSICYGRDKFVAVSASASSKDGFAYSEDGIVWVTLTKELSDIDNWMSVCYGGDRYVAISDSNNTFAYSTDGINWTKLIISLDVKGWWECICYGNDKYLAISRYDKFIYSTDGINWIEINANITSRDWRYVCYGNGKYVAVARNSNSFAYSDGTII